MVTKTPQEMDEMRALIADGKLPADAIEKYYQEEKANVFGVDHKSDRNGNPIEQGIGSRGHETGNHFASLKKAEQTGLEPPGAYDAAVADIWKRDPERARKIGLIKPRAA